MTIEVTAKKVEDAISQGLAQLGATVDEVTVEVVDYGGLFHKAKVRLTLDEPEKTESPAPTPTEAPAPEKAPAEKAEKSDKPEKAAEKPTKAPTAAKKPAAKKAASAEKTEKTVKSDKADKPAAKKPAAKKPASKNSKNESAPTAAADEKTAVKSAPQSEAESAPNAESVAEQNPSDTKSAQKKSKSKKSVGTAPKSEQESTPQDASSEKSKRPLRADEKEAAGRALEFVKKTVELMGFSDFSAECEEGDEGHINLTAPEGDDSLIIGRHGETLSALTYLAETSARAEKSRVNILVDCNGYRARRAASLSAMARRRAHECAAKRRKIKLEPMDRTDRRTIHCALADDKYVTTESEGKEPYRCVVIVPKDGVAADYEERDGRDRQRGGRDRRSGKGNDGAKPAKRAEFNVNLHGFVGHNDNAGEEVEESVPETAKEDGAVLE